MYTQATLLGNIRIKNVALFSLFFFFTFTVFFRTLSRFLIKI